MLYIPYSLKRCASCGSEHPATTQYFLRRKDSIDGLRGECRKCHNARGQAWKAANSAHVAAYHHNRYLSNKEKYQRQHRVWANANTERMRRLRRKWKQDNWDYARDQVRAWAKSNPSKVRTKYMRYRTQKHKLPATYTETDWQYTLEYFGHRCAVCERPVGLWHTLAQDHWIPVSKGGAYTPDNILPLCHGVDGCNNSKGNRDPIEWLTDKLSPHEAQQVLERIEAYFVWARVHLSHD